jgi:hypothetical protein
VAELHLVASDGSPPEDASWFYQLLPLASYREVLRAGDAAVMRAGRFEGGAGEAEGGGLAAGGLQDPSIFRLGEEGRARGGCRLVVASGIYAMADVLGTALVRGRRSYAQTAMLLFGDSLGGEPPVSNSVSPGWPSYNFSGSGELYWPQTGHTFTLTAREGTILGPVRALRDTGPVPGEYAGAENGISFTPAHDPELSAESSSATKPVYLVGRLPGGGTLTYTFYVHRSRTAGTDLPLGILLSAAAFAVTGLGIIVYRSRGRLAREREAGGLAA